MENNNLTLDEYQQLALETAIYPNPIIYPTLGLTGEAGEVSDKVKKCCVTTILFLQMKRSWKLPKRLVMYYGIAQPFLTILALSLVI